jgi:sulfate permease, SulP family
VPAPGWVRGYRRADLGGDAAAGLTVAVMLIPQAMAYALLAGLPPVVGLYAATIPLAVYALLGTSRQLAVGPVAIISLLTLTGVSALAEPGTAEFVAQAAVLALMTGVLQLVLGVVRAGAVASFLSHAVISGFTSAAAIVIALSQLKHLLGIPLPAEAGVPALLAAAVAGLGAVQPETLAIGAAAIALLLLARRYAPRVPGPLLVVLLGTLATWGLGLHDRVAIVGDVPGGLPPLAPPPLDAGVLRALLPAALAITFVGFMESYAVARSLARRGRYRIDADGELRGLGAANVAAGLFSGYPVTGGFSRSAVNYQAGARTQLASLITAALILVALLAFTGLFHFLPRAVLAAIVVVAVSGLVDLKEPVRLLRLAPADGAVLIVTFAATLLIGIEPGIVTGIVLSLLLFLRRSAYPRVARLGWVAAEDTFRDLERYPEAETVPGTLVLRPDRSLYFANAAAVADAIRARAGAEPGLRRLVLDFTGVNEMDAEGADTLAELLEELHAAGVAVAIAGMKGPVRDLARRAGWPARFGAAVAHPTLAAALRPAPEGATSPARSPSPTPAPGAAS